MLSQRKINQLFWLSADTTVSVSGPDSSVTTPDISNKVDANATFDDLAGGLNALKLNTPQRKCFLIAMQFAGNGDFFFHF